MANLEALWIAGELQPGATRRSPRAQAHYTHERISAVLGLPFESIAVDAAGRMDAAALEQRARSAATSARSSRRSARRRSAPSIRCRRSCALRERHGFRVHADAAYGGYFALADNLGAGRARGVRPHRARPTRS